MYYIYVADISVDSNQIRIGTFDTAMQAALAYDQAAINAGKKKATLNFPNDQKEKKEKKEKPKKQKKEKKQKKQKKKGLLAIQEYNEMLQIWDDME